MWGRKCSLFPEHLISLHLGSSIFHPFIIYSLHDYICRLMTGLFACINRTALSGTYFIIAARQEGPNLHIEKPQPTPYQKSQFYSLYIYLIVMRFLSQYIGTHGTGVIAASPILFFNCFGLLPCLTISRMALSQGA